MGDPRSWKKLLESSHRRKERIQVKSIVLKKEEGRRNKE
jgi:hypothetical protein